MTRHFYMLVHVHGDLHVIEATDTELGAVRWRLYDAEAPPRWAALRDEIKGQGYKPEEFSLDRIFWRPAPVRVG